MIDTRAEPSPVLATLLLARATAPDVARLIDEVGPALVMAAGTAPAPAPSADVPLVVAGPGGLIVGHQVAAPLPRERFQWLAEAAWWWRDAAAALDRHAAHLTVGCPWTGSSRLEAHVKHTILVRSLLDQLPVVAVLWGSTLVSPEQYRAMVDEMVADKRLPVSLWIKVGLDRHEGGTLAATIGMGAFGLMEIEAGPADLQPGALFNLVRSFAQYLLTSGPVVADGDRVGDDEATAVRVRHAASFRDAAQTVYRLDHGAA